MMMRTLRRFENNKDVGEGEGKQESKRRIVYKKVVCVRVRAVRCDD